MKINITDKNGEKISLKQNFENINKSGLKKIIFVILAIIIAAVIIVQIASLHVSSKTKNVCDGYVRIYEKYIGDEDKPDYNYIYIDALSTAKEEMYELEKNYFELSKGDQKYIDKTLDNINKIKNRFD